MLNLNQAPLLLEHDYLPIETGAGLSPDGHHYHVAASTYMPKCTAAMIDWWFGYIHTTEQYKLWHPVDHVFSDWEGPRNNDSTYIGGHHLVHEYIGGVLVKLKISFRSPEEYFGVGWKEEFERRGYGTAVCGRVGNWDDGTAEVSYNGHLIHLIKNEDAGGVRMRSRFWKDARGYFGSTGVERAMEQQKTGLMRHATEEMAILASILPGLYAQYCKSRL